MAYGTHGEARLRAEVDDGHVEVGHVEKAGQVVETYPVVLGDGAEGCGGRLARLARLGVRGGRDVRGAFGGEGGPSRQGAVVLLARGILQALVVIIPDAPGGRVGREQYDPARGHKFLGRKIRGVTDPERDPHLVYTAVE